MGEEPVSILFWFGFGGSFLFLGFLFFFFFWREHMVPPSNLDQLSDAVSTTRSVESKERRPIIPPKESMLLSTLPALLSDK